MVMTISKLALSVLLGAQIALAATQQPFTVDHGPDLGARHVSLTPYLNNKATSQAGENDGIGMKNGSTFPASFLPPGQWKHEGVTFHMPDYNATYDNVKADQQLIDVGLPLSASSVHLILTGDDALGFLRGESHQIFGLVFEDKSEVEVGILVRNWFAIHGTNKSPLRAPYHFDGPGDRNYNVSHLFHAEIPVPPTASQVKLAYVRLPPPPANDWNAAHIFALSIVPASDQASPPSIRDKVHVKSVEATRSWEDHSGQRCQVVRVTLINPYAPTRYAESALWLNSRLSIGLESSGIDIISAGSLTRLMPGDEVTVNVLIRPKSKSATFDGTSVVLGADETWRVSVAVAGAGVVHDWLKWTETAEDIEQHSAPDWWSGAKFGIFIHWGPYSVPAWTDEGKYAEWYDWWLHEEGPEGTTHQYHLDRYGADFVYDDFFPHFLGEKFNASDWVDVIARSGAKYFALTTKHHDGYALFDTGKTSDRSSVKLDPKRDFLRELMDASKAERPELKRGTYFSMPEWFHPDYQKHGKVLFPGGLAHDPYHPDRTEPYTGYVPVDDYLEEVQKEQMRILAFDYGTDLMWCDIGLENRTYSFAAEWFSTAAREGRQVAINNRCGIAGDFDTPEMTTFDLVQKTPWESNMGMDPHSFGYNKATRPDEYRNATDIIHTLVDIVAKGGNFLLNIGPDSSGVIGPAMTEPLLEAGKWLELYGEAIYDTRPFALAPEIERDGLRLRFTRTNEHFYIITLSQPSHDWTIPSLLPIMEGDKIMLLSSSGPVAVKWSRDGPRSLNLKVGATQEDALAWVFRVEYAAGTGHIRDEL